jgi:hypothetical protein
MMCQIRLPVCAATQNDPGALSDHTLNGVHHTSNPVQRDTGPVLSKQIDVRQVRFAVQGNTLYNTMIKERERNEGACFPFGIHRGALQHAADPGWRTWYTQRSCRCAGRQTVGWAEGIYRALALFPVSPAGIGGLNGCLKALSNG